MNTEEKQEEIQKPEGSKVDFNIILREIFLGPLFEVPNKA